MGKTVFGIFVLLFTFVAIYPPASLAKSAKPVVAVFYFEADGVSDYVGEAVGGYLMTALAFLDKYKVVDPEKIDKILEGSDIGKGKPIPTETAAALGKKLGAIVACRGKVTKKGDRYTITVDFISTANGAVITSNSANVTGEANLSKGIDRIVGLTKD
jgi:TolB-like protein